MSTSLAGADRPLNRSTKAVIIYDNLVSVLSANAALESMSLKAGGDFAGTEWVASSWQFAMLQPGLMADQALVVADGASLLLLVTTATQPVPDFVKQWIERWASARAQSGAVLGFVLADDKPETAIQESVIAVFLRQLVERSSLRSQFFREVISEVDTLIALRQLTDTPPFIQPLTDRLSALRSSGNGWNPAPDWTSGSGRLPQIHRWCLNALLLEQPQLETAEA
jgi:hypothetical protein